MSEWTAETADWYAAHYGEYATNRLGVDAIDVAPDAVVVDVGCGTGSALRRLAPRVPKGRLVVVEDRGLPGAARATRALRAALERVGMAVRHQAALTEGDVTCTLWVCGGA